MARFVEFSECGKYRRTLMERWGNGPLAVWVLANPSIASDTIPDPTWTKGVGFSKRLGYGGQIFTNVFDYIATKPRDLKRAGYPCSRENDQNILRAGAYGDGRVICGWGAVLHGHPRCTYVKQMLQGAGYTTVALGFTQAGEPWHPLMLAYDTPLVLYA